MRPSPETLYGSTFTALKPPLSHGVLQTISQESLTIERTAV